MSLLGKMQMRKAGGILTQQLKNKLRLKIVYFFLRKYHYRILLSFSGPLHLSEGWQKGWESRDPSSVAVVEAQLVVRGEEKEEDEHHQLSLDFVHTLTCTLQMFSHWTITTKL